MIENVEGARTALHEPVTICVLVRDEGAPHRLFETNWPLMVPPCVHGQQGQPVGVYGTGGGGQMARATRRGESKRPARSWRRRG